MFEIMTKMLKKSEKKTHSKHGASLRRFEECVADGCALSLLYNKVN